MDTHTYVMLPLIGPPTIEVLADSPTDLDGFDARAEATRIAREWHDRGNAIRCRGTTSTMARYKAETLRVAQLAYEAVDSMEGRVDRPHATKLVIRLGNIG